MGETTRAHNRPWVLGLAICAVACGCDGGSETGDDAGVPDSGSRDADAEADGDGALDGGGAGDGGAASDADGGSGADADDAPDADGVVDGSTDGDAPADADVRSRTIAVPAEGEWTDAGVVLEAGSDGEWDHILWGAFGGSAVVFEGTYLLYYQGAEYYSDVEESVAYRAIGLATSTDGLLFEKSSASPVLEWLPTDGEEEGATSSAALVGPAGDVVAFYGANTFAGALQVNADGRVATSADGVTFVDQGIALDHSDASVWGSGDELFPIVAFHHGGTYCVYYIPNGSPERGLLGVACGPEPTSLATTSQVTSGGGPVPAWGMGAHARLDDETHVLFVNDVTARRMEARTFDPDVPAELSAPVEVYAFEGFTQGTVLLDLAEERWLLYYRTTDPLRYEVKTASIRYLGSP